MTLSPFFYSLAAFLLTAVLIPPALKMAARAGFLDRPDGRKQHEGAVPPIGGLVVFPVFMLVAGFWLQDWRANGWFFGALTLTLITGALDDKYTVPPRIRFLLQFAAACMIATGGAKVAAMGDLFGFGVVWLGFLSIPFSIVATVLLINAVNLMDGLDGLAGGMGVIVLGCMALCASFNGSHPETAELLILCGALCGFLLFNMRSPWRGKACVFLGDAGSLALGLAISWYAIRLAGQPEPVVAPASVAWMLGLPIMDTCGQFARRVAEGRSPFSADHNHFHHLFVQAGMPVGKATAYILGIILLYSAIGIVGIQAGLPSWLLMYIWAVLLLIHIKMAMRPDRFRGAIARVFP